MANIRLLSSGKYKITVSNGRDINGKQIREYTTWTPDPDKTMRQNKKALELFAMEFEEKVKSGNFLDGEKMRYVDFIELWKKNYCEKQLQVTSIERIDNELRKILPVLGHLKLTQIKPFHIQQFYSDLMDKGYTKNGKHYEYSTTSIKRVHEVISSSLNSAVQWQLIESNPCNRVKAPKVAKQVDVKHFTLEQAQAFLDYLPQPYTVTYRGRRKKDGSPSAEHTETRYVPLQFQVFYHLALFGGFRRGELIALTWDDIDFEKHTVSITKSAARTKKDGMINKSPKNFSSNRTITMPAEIMRMLKRLKLERNEYRLSVGSYWDGENYVFIQDNGHQMDISTPNYEMRKIIRRYNAGIEDEKDKLPEINVHGLRHTSATLLISQNIDIKTVSNRLGHSETSTTMDIYAHALEKQDAIAAESLSAIFQKNA